MHISRPSSYIVVLVQQDLDKPRDGWWADDGVIGLREQRGRPTTFLLSPSHVFVRILDTHP